MKRNLIFAIVIAASVILRCQTRLIDNLNNLNTWHKVISEGAKMDLSLAPGVKGKSFAINYSFTGSGYCGIVKDVSLNLPDNYKFTFYLKANSPKNNLEFKLDDSTGNNVWWHVDRSYDFPVKWTKHTIRKRDISFAWGPKGGGVIKKVYKIEIIISAAAGGKGTVYLDDLSFTKLPPPVKKIITPSTFASTTMSGKPSNLFDKNFSTYWRSNKNNDQFLIFNFKYLREYGGIIINWDSLDYATDFNIESSNNRKNWEIIYKARNENRIQSFIPLPDNESKYMKIQLLKSSRHRGYAIKEIEIENYKFTEDNNYFFEQVAKHYPEGYYPKYLHNIQTYWDVIGVNGDKKDGLINEEGMIETSKESFSVEPFIYSNNKFITWNNVKTKQSLEDKYLPIPIVEWENKNLLMQIKSLAWGDTGASSMYVRYTITNKSNSIQKGSLYLAIRPFQVSPPWQSLNLKGGVAKIKSIKYENGIAFVNKYKKIVSLTSPSNFGAVTFTNGAIINYIDKNKLPPERSVYDSLGYASGAFQYKFELKPGKHFDAVIAIPFYKKSPNPNANESKLNADLYFSKTLSSVKNYWDKKLNKVQFNLPASAKKMVNTLRSNLAYILINRSGNALQPGSRCYARSWIRDGSLMSAALLRMGITKEVKDYINWYSKYQFPSGRIPCLVDRVGADPVPENDSQGEYIFLLLQYFKFTKDTSMLRSKWNNIKKTVAFMKHQINEESTAKYKYGTNEQKSFYGLVPASISHEGYVKPEHSYWDDFFVILGLKDAVTISKILGMKKEESEYKKIRNTFRTNLYNSMRLAMKNTGIDYIPGCAELGDFDATSTAIGIFPCNELKNIPEPQLHNTFNKYYKFFKKRLNPDYKWINYTPYEIRIAGAFIYLNEIKRTYNLLNFFFKDQRPEGWNDWAEVVWKNKNTPKFIGDMPHTWVGSGYINTFRALFVYEDVNDSSLVLGAGIKSAWLNKPGGISINNLPTYYGKISYSMKKEGNKVFVQLKDSLDSSCKRIILKSPLKLKIKNVLVDGKSSSLFRRNDIFLKHNARKIIIVYR